MGSISRGTPCFGAAIDRWQWRTVCDRSNIETVDRRLVHGFDHRPCRAPARNAPAVRPYPQTHHDSHRNIGTSADVLDPVAAAAAAADDVVAAVPVPIPGDGRSRCGA